LPGLIALLKAKVNQGSNRMYDPDANQPPLNPLPPVVWILALAIVGVELMFQAGEAGFIGGPEAVGWRLEHARNFGFFDAVFDWMRQNRSFPLEHVQRFVTFHFVHGSFTHAAFVVVFILALGKFVGELFSPWSVLVVFFGSAIIGVAGYSIILDESNLIIGGYPGVYGLIGAFTWVLFMDARMAGNSGISAFRLIAFFMALQLIYKILFNTSNEWLAELIAFGSGFALSFLVAPNAGRRLNGYLNQLRNRR
jgi:membrane associated rhomboid family serine protease